MSNYHTELFINGQVRLNLSKGIAFPKTVSLTDTRTQYVKGSTGETLTM